MAITWALLARWCSQLFLDRGRMVTLPGNPAVGSQVEHEVGYQQVKSCRNSYQAAVYYTSWYYTLSYHPHFRKTASL